MNISKFPIPFLFIFLAPVFSIAQNTVLAPGNSSTTHSKTDTAFFNKGPGGLLYKIYVDKHGTAIKPGDFVAINFIVKNDQGVILSSSYDGGRPAVTLMNKPNFAGDIYAGMAMLSEGDSAVIKVNIDSASKTSSTIKNQKGKYIWYEVKVEKVISKDNLSGEVFKEKATEYVKSLTDDLKKQEPLKIKKYIADNKLEVTETTSGLSYVITKQGFGIKPAIGDTVVVNYTAKLTGGKIIETTMQVAAAAAKISGNPAKPYEPLRVPVLASSGMIAGWNEGMLLLNKGAKAILIMPSAIAYGEQGIGTVPPFTPVIFEVELVDVIHPANSVK